MSWFYIQRRKSGIAIFAREWSLKITLTVPLRRKKIMFKVNEHVISIFLIVLDYITLQFKITF